MSCWSKWEGCNPDWGARAPRPHISAPRRNAVPAFQCDRCTRSQKFVMARAPSPAREERALPSPLHTFFERRADFVAPFGPRTIVIADVIEPQQIGEHEPRVT